MPLSRPACDNRHSMNLQINGAPRDVPAGLTLAALLEHLGMKGDRVAVELNRNIAPRDQWAATQLHDGDQIEIVHFVGGGSCRRRASSPVLLILSS